MVARRTPRRIPQPAVRPVGRLDDGDTVNLSRAEIAEYFALSARDTPRSPRETSGLVCERLDIALDGGRPDRVPIARQK